MLPRPTLRLRPFLVFHKTFTEFRPDFGGRTNLPIGAVAARVDVSSEVDGPRCRIVIANREVQPIARQTAA
jgi:hypothetical protein